MEAEDASRFAAIFAANYARVHAFAHRRLGPDLADEIAAETFLVAWRRLDVVPDQPLPWLYGVARNMVLREHRARARESAAQQLLNNEWPLASASPEGQREDVWHAWGDLSASDREVLALIAWEELSVSEAAHVLGVPASVFSVRLHRARRRFERHLQRATAAVTAPAMEAT
jgi:RNA polymerase sigma-70 factor (ECF subfamily)